MSELQEHVLPARGIQRGFQERGAARLHPEAGAGFQRESEDGATAHGSGGKGVSPQERPRGLASGISTDNSNHDF